MILSKETIPNQKHPVFDALKNLNVRNIARLRTASAENRPANVKSVLHNFRYFRLDNRTEGCYSQAEAFVAVAILLTQIFCCDGISVR